MYTVLAGVDLPDALTDGLRRTLDAPSAVLERPGCRDHQRAMADAAVARRRGRVPAPVLMALVPRPR